VVFLVGNILGTVPGDPHRDSVSHWRSTSTADQQKAMGLLSRQPNYHSTAPACSPLADLSTRKHSEPCGLSPSISR
jgi:hypothetical protein